MKRVLDFIAGLPATLVYFAVIAVLVFCLCNAQRKLGEAKVAAEASDEAAKAKAAKVALDENVKRADLLKRLALATSDATRNGAHAAALEAAVKRLLGAAKGGHVVSVETGDTGWIPGYRPDSSPNTARTCLYYEGDEGRIRTGRVEGQYKSGKVTGVVAAASAYGREKAGAPERLLFSHELHLDVASLEGSGSASRQPWWGLDTALTLRANGGLEAGLGLASPPYPFLWDRLLVEPRLAVNCSISPFCNTWALTGAATWRLTR